MICACLVPARIATGLGVVVPGDVSAASFGAEARRCFALRRLLMVLATIGSMPIAVRPASVAISVVPWPFLVSRQSGSPRQKLASTSSSQPRYHLGHRHLGRSACQPFGQRHGQIIGARRRAAEDDGLRVGEFGHLGLLS